MTLCDVTLSSVFPGFSSYLCWTCSPLLLWANSTREFLRRRHHSLPPTAYRLPPPPSLLPLPPPLLEMESAENNKAPGATVSTPLPFSPTSSSNSGLPRSPPALVVLSPCAACKILRRRCADKCVLAPYFPPTEPLKFTIAHRVFGASNIIKLLQVYLHLSLSLSLSIYAYLTHVELHFGFH